MTNEFRRFIRGWSVMSKTSEQPQVALYDNKIYVFVRGYPMTYQGFLNMSMKAIYGPQLKYPGKVWESYHKETRELCKGLKILLYPEKEAFSVLKRLSEYYKTSSYQDYNNDFIEAAAKAIDDKIAEMKNGDEA